MKVFYKNINGVPLYLRDTRHKERLEKALSISELLPENEIKIRLIIYLNSYKNQVVLNAKSIEHALALYNEINHCVYPEITNYSSDALIIGGEEDGLVWTTEEGKSFTSYDVSLCLAQDNYLDYLEYLYTLY